MISSPPPAGIAKKSTAIGVGIFAFVLLVLAFPSLAPAHPVEEDSLDNRLYVLLWHQDLLHPLDVTSVTLTLPSCCSGATSVHIPPQVPADSGRLAVFEFDVNPATLGFTGNAVVTVSGTVNGSPRQVDLSVPIEVVANAPPPATVNDNNFGMEEVDTDGDGVADWVEELFGSDPNDPFDMPGMKGSAPIPALSPAGLALSALLLVLAAALLSFRRRRRGTTLGGPR